MRKMIGILVLVGLAGATARAQVLEVTTVPYDESAQTSGPPTARDGFDNILYLENTESGYFFFPSLSPPGVEIVEVADDIHNDLPMFMTGFSLAWVSFASAGAGPQSMTLNFYENDANDNFIAFPPVVSYAITGLTTGLNTTTVKVNTVLLPANNWMGVMFSHDDMGLPLAGDFWPEVGQPSHDLVLVRLDDGDLGLEFGPGSLALNLLIGIFGASIPEPTTLVLFGISGLLVARPRRP